MVSGSTRNRADPFCFSDLEAVTVEVEAGILKNGYARCSIVLHS